MKTPLKNPCWELYAHERALGKSPREACRVVYAQFGKFKPETGAATKLEGNPAVLARLTHLRQLDDEMIAAKRERIERRLTLTAEFNPLAFAKIDPETGAPMLDWQKILGSDYAVALSPEFDEAGAITRVRRDDPNAAIAQLRDMHGFKAASKVEHTGKGGGPLTVVDLSKMSDEQLATLETIFGPLAGTGDDDAPDPRGTDQAAEGAGTP